MLFIELLHMLHVSPLACRETLVICAPYDIENAIPFNKIIVFIILFFLLVF
jgi:hypothetical protein